MKIKSLITAFLLLLGCGLSAGAAQTEMLYLYTLKSSPVTVGSKVVDMYAIDAKLELNTFNGGETYRCGNLSLPANTPFVIGSADPVLYPEIPDGSTLDEYVENVTANPLKFIDIKTASALSKTDFEIYTAADKEQTGVDAVAKIYRYANPTDYGVLVFTPGADFQTMKLEMEPALYFSLTKAGSTMKFDEDNFEEFSTADGVTYTLDNLTLGSGEAFYIGTNRSFSHALHLVSPKVKPGDGFETDNDDYCVCDEEFSGSLTVTVTGDKTTIGGHAKYKVVGTRLESGAFYLYYLDGRSITDVLPFNYVVEDGFEGYELGPLTIEKDTEFSLSTRTKRAGNKIANTAASVTSLPQAGREFGQSWPMEWKLTSCPIYEVADNFYGVIRVAKSSISSKYSTGQSDSFEATFTRKTIRPPYDPEDFNANKTWDKYELLDKKLANDEVADGRLADDSKPIYHDREQYINESRITVPFGVAATTEMDLVYMEGRRALVGPGCTINRLASGSLANVINVQTSLGNITAVGDEALYSSADFTGIAEVKLTTAPLVSVRDTKRYYAAGTQAGFNIVAASNTSVLSLSVIETMSVAFYRDGNLMAVCPVDASTGSGVSLSLITISTGDGSYDMTAVAPCVFDEIAIFTADGVKLNVGSNFKVNYAFVGRNQEITLGTNGIASYNAKHPDNQLYVYETSTTFDSAGLFGYGRKGNKTYEFAGDESKAENLTNTLSLLTGGTGWAEIKMDSYGENATPADKQLFKKGSRINFYVSGGSLLKLGLGTGNTITFYKRTAVEEATGSEYPHDRKVTWDKGKAYVLSATVLELGVVDINGGQVISMVAPDDFSGARLTVNDGLVNLGETSIYYASVTPPPYQEHKCALGIPTDVRLYSTNQHVITKTTVEGFNDDGVLEKTEKVTSHTVQQTVPSVYTPSWDKSVAVGAGEDNPDNLPVISWQLVETPAGASNECDPQTGTFSIDAEGEYTLHYEVGTINSDGLFEPDETHGGCSGNLIVHVHYDFPSAASDDEIKNLIGSGIIVEKQNGWTVSQNTHGVLSGGITLGQTGGISDEAVIDGKLNTYATLPVNISLAENKMLVGMKKTNGTFGQKGKPCRVGFLVEERLNGLDATALNYYNIRWFDPTQTSDVDLKTREAQTLVVEESQSIEANLIGSKKASMVRLSVVIPGDKIPEGGLYEIQLWTSGVLSANLSSMKIFGAFIEEDYDPSAANQNWKVGQEGETIHGTAQVVPMTVGTVDVQATDLTNLSFLIDKDLDTALNIGNGVGVGKGATISVPLGRIVTPNEKIGIILDSKSYLADVNVGDWLTVKTYCNGNISYTEPEYKPLGEKEELIKSETESGQTPESVSVEGNDTMFKSSQSRAESDPYIDKLDDWKVVGANVIGYGDKTGIYFIPKKPVDEIKFEIGDVAQVLNSFRIYGITTSPAVGTSDRYTIISNGTVSGIDDMEIQPGDIIVVNNADGSTDIDAASPISSIAIYAVDGSLRSLNKTAGKSTGTLNLEKGMNIVVVTLSNGNATTLKLIR